MAAILQERDRQSMRSRRLESSMKSKSSLAANHFGFRRREITERTFYTAERLVDAIAAKASSRAKPDTRGPFETKVVRRAFRQRGRFINSLLIMQQSVPHGADLSRGERAQQTS